jgi:hypothetical protein
MTKISRAAYKALYGSAGSQFPDNTSGQIVPSRARSFGEDGADSFYSKTDDLYLSGSTLNVKDYSLTGDGTTDDSGAFTALITAATAGDTIEFPKGTYKLSSVVTVSKLLYFKGNSATIYCPNNSIGITISSSTAKGTSFRDLKFLGTGRNSGSTGQHGLYFSTCGAFRVVNCEFKDFGGAGIKFEQTSSFDNLGGLITSCDFYTNNYAIYSSTQGEYCTIVGNNINVNNNGIYQLGGNNVIVGNNLDYNTDAIVIASGANNAHGLIANCNINHSVDYALKLWDYADGQSIQNCNIYDGAIYLKNADGSTRFEDCFLNASHYYFENSDNTIFRNCIFDDDYIDGVDNNYNATTSTTSYINCSHLDGRRVIDPDTFMVALISDDVVVNDASAFYMGDPSANDSWRIIRSGNNLLHQRREAGSWVTKNTITP